MTKETMCMMEEELVEALREMSHYEVGSDQWNAFLSEVTVLSGKLNELHVKELEYQDKVARREMEERRNGQMAIIEMEKNDISWKRIGLELSKVVIPVLISGILYGVYQKRLLAFEENGRLTSHASRELHLPKFW